MRHGDSIEEMSVSLMTGDIDYITSKIEKQVIEEIRSHRIDKVHTKKKYDDRHKISKGRSKHGGSKRKNPKKT